MPRLDNSIDIRAPRDRVFQYISDIETHPEWVKWAKKAENTSPGHKGVGATHTLLMQVGPRKETVDEIVTEYKEDTLFTRRHTSGMEMEERLALVGIGDSTKVAWSIDYKPPMGAMGKAMDMLFMVRLFDQLMVDSLSNLKERLENAR